MRARARSPSPWALVGLAVVLATVHFIDRADSLPGFDASLYVIPVLLTIWIPGRAVTLGCGIVAILLGGICASHAGGGVGTVAAAAAFGGEALAIAGAIAAVWLTKRTHLQVAAADRGWLAVADAAPVLIRVGSAESGIWYVNDAWTRLLGCDASDLAGRPWTELGSAIPELPSQGAGGASVARSEAEFRVIDCEGRPRWILEHVSPRPRGGGVNEGFVGFAIDVTHRHEAERAVLENRARLAEAERSAALGHAELAVLPGAKPLWSEGLYRLLGLDPDAIEPSLEAFVSFVAPEDRERLTTELRHARELGHWREITVRIQRRDGEKRVLRMNAQRLEASDSKPARFFATLQDVTERVEMERSLLEHRNSLAKAQEVANLGSWAFEPATGRVFWSDQMTSIFGVDAAILPDAVEDFVERVVHPADREQFLTSWPRVLAERLPVSSEYRVVRANGEIGVIRAQCEYVNGGADKPDVVVGTCQDVTDMRAAELALRESEERFDLAAKGANDGIWDWPDVTQDDLWISPRYFELLGYENHAFRPSGEYFNTQLVHPDDVQRNLDAVRSHLETQAPYNIELRLRTKNGYRWFQMRGQAIFTADGRPIRMAGSMQDIHDRKLAEAQIETYQEKLRSLAYAAVVAAERERRRIGVELHDRTIQTLGVASMKLAELTERRSHGDGGLLLEEARALIKETIRDTRALLAELGPPVLYELGFEAAVEWLAEQAGSVATGTRFSVFTDEAPKPLGEGSQVVLFQAVRELLANVNKHARASSATIRLERQFDTLRVTVTDDGVGFDPARVSAPDIERGGFGLFSIREGLRLLGGNMEVLSDRAGGTRVTLLVPLEMKQRPLAVAANGA